MGNTLDNNLVSRQAVLDMLKDINAETEGVGFYYEHYVEYIKNLPSATPKEKTGKYDKLKEAVGKIKAEIKAYDKKDRYPYGALGVSTALKIIDNHTEGLI